MYRMNLFGALFLVMSFHGRAESTHHHFLQAIEDLSKYNCSPEGNHGVNTAIP